MTERFTLLRDLIRGLKWVGVFYIVISLFVLTASALGVTWGCESASAEEQRQVTLVVCVGASSFLVVWTSLTALAIRTAVITGQRSLFVRGLFSQQTIPWDEISRARWSGGGLTLYWPGGRRKVSGANFIDDRGKQLLRILRARIDREVQEGWNEHYERLLQPPRIITRAQHDETIRSMYRCVILCSLPASILTALALAIVAQLPAAAYRQLAVRAVLSGLATMAMLLAWYSIASWFHRPTEPPAND